jgi:hypothetical protein
MLERMASVPLLSNDEGDIKEEEEEGETDAVERRVRHAIRASHIFSRNETGWEPQAPAAGSVARQTVDTLTTMEAENIGLLALLAEARERTLGNEAETKLKEAIDALYDRLQERESIVPLHRRPFWMVNPLPVDAPSTPTLCTTAAQSAEIRRAYARHTQRALVALLVPSAEATELPRAIVHSCAFPLLRDHQTAAQQEHSSYNRVAMQRRDDAKRANDRKDAATAEHSIMLANILSTVYTQYRHRSTHTGWFVVINREDTPVLASVQEEEAADDEWKAPTDDDFQAQYSDNTDEEAEEDAKVTEKGEAQDTKTQPADPKDEQKKKKRRRRGKNLPPGGVTHRSKYGAGKRPRSVSQSTERKTASSRSRTPSVARESQRRAMPPPPPGTPAATARARARSISEARERKQAMDQTSDNSD